MRDLLSAVSYIHYKKIIHKDIKMENIVFAKKGVIDHLKLIDFGSAIPFEKGKLYFNMSGSPYYMAPEMLSGDGFNEKADVWSCGIIFHFLLTGSFPFSGKTELDVLHMIQQKDIVFIGKRYSHVPFIALKLLKRMLTKHPASRISASEARQDPYFQYDELDTDIIQTGLLDIRRFLNYGIIQTSFFRLYVDKLCTENVLRMNRRLFFFLNSASNGEISKQELYQAYQRFKI